MNSVLTQRHALSLAALAGGALIGTGIFAWMGRRSRREAAECIPAAAYAGEGGHRDAYSHTRDAGPDHIRDEDGSDWDALDQASDESFPSSDPPAANNFASPKPIDYKRHRL